MKNTINEMETWLRNKGVKCEIIYPDFEDKFILITNTGLYSKESVAELIRKHGYNCHIM